MILKLELLDIIIYNFFMKFIRKVLPNKTRVILIPMAGIKSVNLLVLAGTGSNYETKQLNGISHFIEHLFFKGTKSRPTSDKIAGVLDGIGAKYNAFTEREVTGYWVKSASKHFPLILNIVSDMIINPLFNPNEIEKERMVILEEIKMYNDIPQRKIFNNWFKLVYGNQPEGRPISGTKKTIKNILRDDIIKYKNTHYVGSNLVVVAAGDIKPKQFTEISKNFSKVKKAASPRKQKTLEKQNGPGIYFEQKQTDQTHLVIGATAANIYDSKKYPLFLFDIAMGGMMSSRFFKELREKLGLGYYVHTSYEPEIDTGQFVLRTGVAHKNLELTINKIIEIIKDIKEKGITKEELNLAKENFRGQLAISMETPDEVAMFYGEQEIFGLPLQTPEELLKKILAVSQNDIKKIANELFRPNKINLAVIGPHKNTSFYKKKLAAL